MLLDKKEEKNVLGEYRWKSESQVLGREGSGGRGMYDFLVIVKCRWSWVPKSKKRGDGCVVFFLLWMFVQALGLLYYWKWYAPHFYFFPCINLVY